MACPQVYSGASFLSSTLAYVDCQAQSIGTFGFQALSTPNSTGQTVVTGLLTLFVAIFGFRLILGFPMHGRDVFSAVLKIAIVLTLATSWSTVRTLAYDTVLYGPAEVAGAITGSSDVASRYALTDRLEQVDAGIMALTTAGTGRGSIEQDDITEDFSPGAAGQQTAAEAAFAPIAVDDEFGMGFSRVAYLAGTLTPLVALRVAAGVLIALAPLIAGLLLFERTQGIFFGWVRALVLIALGSLAMIVSLSVELALLEPWIADVLARRSARYVTPAAPTELLVVTTSFAVVAFALLFLLARLAFHPGAVTRFVQGVREPGRERAERTSPASIPAPAASAPHRAAQVAERMTTIYRGERQLTRDEGADANRQVSAGSTQGGQQGGSGSFANAALMPLGTTYRPTARRSTTRSSRTANTRDRRL